MSTEGDAKAAAEQKQEVSKPKLSPPPDTIPEEGHPPNEAAKPSQPWGRGGGSGRSNNRYNNRRKSTDLSGLGAQQEKKPNKPRFFNNSHGRQKSFDNNVHAADQNQPQGGATAKDRRQAYNKQRSNSHKNFASSDQQHKSGEGGNLVGNRNRDNKSRSMSTNQMDANGDVNADGDNGAQKKRQNRGSTASNGKSKRQVDDRLLKEIRDRTKRKNPKPLNEIPTGEGGNLMGNCNTNKSRSISDTQMDATGDENADIKGNSVQTKRRNRGSIASRVLKEIQEPTKRNGKEPLNEIPTKRTHSMSNTQMDANGDENADVKSNSVQTKRWNRGSIDNRALKEIQESTKRNNQEPLNEMPTKRRYRRSKENFELRILNQKNPKIEFDDEESVELNVENVGTGYTDAPRKIRGPKSLITLAGVFLSFLQTTSSGLIDVPKALAKLKIPSARRVYDIIHVLQGIGLAEKHSKNVIYWAGGEHSVKLRAEQREYIDKLKAEIFQLERREHELDGDIRCLRQSIRNVCEDPRNCNLLYNTHEEIMQILPGAFCVAVNTSLNASIQMKNVNELLEPQSKKYEMNISSRVGIVEMRVLNKESCVITIENDNYE